jgi:transcriptional regulator with GAF, ATPase, and Fis domain
VSDQKKRSINLEHEIRVLSEISTLVQGSTAEINSFEEIFGLLGQIVDFRSASLYVFSKETGKLEEICNVGRKVDLIDFVKFEMGSGISAWVAKHGRCIILNNLRKSKGGTHTKSFLSVPMTFAKEIIGVVNLAHDETDSFTKRDSEVVSIAASIMALLVERISRGKIMDEHARHLAALEHELEEVKRQKLEKSRSFGDPGLSLYKKIGNSLAIISGNAQFLIMTLKSANPSVIKRLRAIDREAGIVAALAQGHGDMPLDLDLDFVFEHKTESPLPI